MVEKFRNNRLKVLLCMMLLAILLIAIYSNMQVKEKTALLPQESNGKFVNTTQFIFPEDMEDSHWGIDAPLVKLKDFNLFREYWTFEGNPDFLLSVSKNKFVLQKKTSYSFPQMESEHVSKVVFTESAQDCQLRSTTDNQIYWKNDKIVIPEFTDDEMQLFADTVLHAWVDYPTEDNEKVFFGAVPYEWRIRFYFDGAENLYYQFPNTLLCKGNDNQYYLVSAYNLDKKIVRLPAEFNLKIDDCFSE